MECQDDIDHFGATALIEAILRFVEDSVSLTAEFLSALPIDLQPCSAPWPSALLLEASAVATIQNWDRRGVTSGIDPTLPSSDVAWSEILLRLQKDPGSFIVGRTPLLVHVFEAWFRQRLKHGYDTLHFERFATAVDQGNLINELALLLWNFRHLKDHEPA